MKKKNIDYQKLYQYFIIENHTTEEAANYFKLHERTLRRRLKEYNIQKSLELQLAASRRVQNERYGGMFVQTEYYKQIGVPKMKQKLINTCLEKYGCEWAASADCVKKKTTETCMNKYGVTRYTQTREYVCKSKRFYAYDDEMFDSSWELALWIYAKDHQESIQRCPCSFEYFVKGKLHKYYPDFLYKGQLIEIKGDFYLNAQQELVEYNSQKTSELTRAKTQCMRDNCVIVYTQKDVQFALDYIYNKYGRSYLKSFQIR